MQPFIDRGFAGLFQMSMGQIIVPMLYPKNENPRKLFACKGFRSLSVVPTGIEPVSRV